ncbi:hypothetical protein [Pseudovibrio brasiliensis]|uniref:Lipoprotein n=1 Tax=Pseudovibrio brasiliensis TaxID=1898042 RepID=A0ABX8AL18_9HYPH|nr:hypothetical protein [Pseudovibrio brasiliensis]QUS55790.1 hypothetical protein KGB56_21300 [Pseudovibrio brasiliensis]
MKKSALLFLFSLGLQACASTLSMSPKLQEGQKEVYDSGVATVISKKQNTIVALRPATSTYESTQRPEMIVSVFNRSAKEFNISTQNVKVLVDGKPAKIRTYEELVADVKRQQTMQAIAAAFAGAADSINAANSGYTYHSGSTSVYGNNGYSGYGTYSGRTYNAAAANQAQAAASARSQANFTAIRQNAERSLINLSKTILRKTTVMPNGWEGGYIVFEKVEKSQEPHEITFLVETAGEVHEFTFDHNKM